VTTGKDGVKKTLTEAPPWPVLIGGGPSLNEGTVILVSADAKSLRARLLTARDGRLLAEFSAEKPTGDASPTSRGR
jgi:hypothetical protein